MLDGEASSIAEGFDDLAGSTRKTERDPAVRSFEEWRTQQPEPEPEPELEPTRHEGPLGLDSSSDSAGGSPSPKLTLEAYSTPGADSERRRKRQIYEPEPEPEPELDGGEQGGEAPLGIVEAAEVLRRALRLSVGSEIPLPARLRGVRDTDRDTAASRAGQLLKMVAQAAATQTNHESEGETVWELVDAQCRSLLLPTGWTAFHTAVYEWVPQTSPEEMAALAAAAAANQRKFSAGVLCARFAAAVIPGARYNPPGSQQPLSPEFSPSRRQRVGGGAPGSRISVWGSDVEWSDTGER